MAQSMSPIDDGLTPQLKFEKPSNSPQTTENIAINDEDLRCGYWNYRPKWMQFFNNPKPLLVFLSFSAFVQGFVVNGVINVNMSTLERRFDFGSSQSGWIASVYDLFAAPLALFVTFMGSVGYKQRWLGCGFIALGLGSFIMAVPHFTTDNYYWQKTDAATCSNISEVCNSDTEESTLQNYLYVFLLGQVFHSVGGCILYTLGVTCLDDVVKPRITPLYIGIMMFFATLGPALGYILGGQFLNIYVDLNAVTLSPTSTQWVGAWWISFLISGTLSILIGPIFLGYAKELPITQEIRESRENEAHQGFKVIKLKHPNTGISLKELPTTIFSLICNPCFILISLASAGEGILLSGMATFLPKFLENQFSLTASWASMLAGFIGIPSAAGGHFLGGYICKRLNLDVTGKCRLSIVTLTVGLFLSGILWVKCDKVKFAGITVPYPESTLPVTTPANSLPLKINRVSADCNRNCNCDEEYYNPVCGSNGVQYFSSCHAGCTMYNKTDKIYSNCACIHPMNKTADNDATEGPCPNDTCVYLPIALVIIFLLTFTKFLALTPLIAIILRCVPDDQRTIGVGVSNFIGRIIGTFPGPLLFGFAIDKACIVWKQSSCADDLSCWIYEDRTLSRNFFILFVVLRLYSLSLLVLANCLYKPPSHEQNNVPVSNVIADNLAYVSD